MPKNDIDSVRDHLVAQLERLGDEQLTDEQLKHEIARGSAISEIAREITASAKAEVDMIRAVGGEPGSNLWRNSLPQGGNPRRIGRDE